MTVQLVDHPAFPTEVLAVDHDVLDALADSHLDDLGDGAPEMERFLFGVVPITVFDGIFGGRSRFDDAVGRWLLHLSGYFGGRWLRGEIAAAQPDAPLVGFSMAPTAEAHEATMARARRSIEAASSDDGAALAFARASLLDTDPTEPGGPPVPGLADSFGYNAGYNLEILASPPAGVDPTPAYDVRCTGLLRCEYATPKLAVLRSLEPTADALNGGDTAYTELAAALQPIQDAALPRGHEVWSTGLSVQGFGQRAYDQLLEVSSSFLETVQASALTMVEGTVQRDVASARTGSRAVAAMTVWLDAYTAGLINGEGTIALPTFEL